MKLINFKEVNSPLSKLVAKMGASYPDIDFTSQWKILEISELDLILNTEGIEIESSQLQINPVDDTFVYEGRRVLVYIKNQVGSYYNGEVRVSDYRFHIVNCKTINEFRVKGKFDKFVVSTRNDNQFVCNIIVGQEDPRNQFDQLRELMVCKNCLDQLCYLKFCNRTTAEKNEIHESFNLTDYFNKYNSTFVEKPRFTDRNQPVGLYPENWPEISRKIRIKYNWICQKCNGDFTNRKAFLDTHHIDSNPGNCEEKNLIPLCKPCHRKIHR